MERQIAKSKAEVSQKEVEIGSAWKLMERRIAKSKAEVSQKEVGNNTKQNKMKWKQYLT